MQDDDFGLCAAHFRPFSFLGATIPGPLEMVAPIAPFFIIFAPFGAVSQFMQLLIPRIFFFRSHFPLRSALLGTQINGSIPEP
jgi:hypothetical protein